MKLEYQLIIVCVLFFLFLIGIVYYFNYKWSKSECKLLIDGYNRNEVLSEPDCLVYDYAYNDICKEINITDWQQCKDYWINEKGERPIADHSVCY